MQRNQPRSLSLLLVSVLAWIGVAVAQDPVDAVRRALFARDEEAAARAAATVASPAARARLQAALLPASERPLAMLAVARAYPADTEAEHALLAGVAAMLLGMQRGSAVPGFAALTAALHEDDGMSDEAVAGLLLAYSDAVADAVDRGVVLSSELVQARALLDLAFASRFGLDEPARVARNAIWARPKGLVQPLELRASPCRAGALDWSDVLHRGEPAWHGTLSPEGPIDLTPLPLGSWLLEARTPDSPWWGLRTVEVSDLGVVALAGDGVLALGAFDAGGPAAAHWQFGTKAGELAHGDVGAAPIVTTFAWPDGVEEAVATLRCEGAAGTSWRKSDWRLGPSAPVQQRWLVHGMVDRPLYRAGDTVRGRLVLLACAWQGTGAAAVPSTRAAADQDLVVQAQIGGSDVRVPVHTDAHGIAEFAFPVPAEVGPDVYFRFVAELPERDEKGDPLRLELGYLAQTSGQRLRAVQFDLDGPEAIAPDAKDAAITVRATWTSGGPAAGVDVEVRDEEDQRVVHLRTDASGRATLTLPSASLRGTWNRLRFRLTGPDGSVEERRHWVRVQTPVDAAEAAQQERERAQREPLRVELGDAIVGATCRVTAFGRPGAHALLVAGRGGNARVQAMQFGSEGQVVYEVRVLRGDWPRLDVTVATATDRAAASTQVRLRPALTPRVELPATAAPGSDLVCRVHTGASGALVTIAIVDERVFELVDDRTREPDESLLPDPPRPGWVAFGARAEESPQQVLASLLANGRLPAWDGMQDVARRNGPPAHGFAGPSSPAVPSVRRNFAATAAFATVVADAAGEAVLPFHLPDDLTRWRATAVVVDGDGDCSGAIVLTTFASRLPLAADPILPRVVRDGDTFALPVVVDRAPDAAAAGDEVAVQVAATGALHVEHAPEGIHVPAGRVVRTAVPLRATAAGDATIAFAAALGDHADRSERAVVVAPDAVARAVPAAVFGTGRVTVPLPAEAMPDRGVTVDVLQGGAAAWHLLEADLARYPYGCAEQTLARLVPYFAAVRAAKDRGEPLPAMDAAFQKRLAAGIARLCDLQQDGMFAFWPGGKPDPGITALVLHALCALRSGGYDLARSGLWLDAWRYRDRLPELAQNVAPSPTWLAEAELQIAVVRLFAAKDRLSGASAKAVFAHLDQLPAGLCARLGLALHAAGDDASARACLQRLQAAALPALRPDQFPGEDPLAVQALRLELALELALPAAELDRATADLLLACLQGQGSTYGRSTALAVLARVLPRAVPRPAAFAIVCGGQQRDAAFDQEHADVVQVHLPTAADVVVTGPADLPLLVRVSGERSERASDHAEWASPIRVERDLGLPIPGVAGDAPALAALGGPPAQGQRLVLRLRVTSPVPMRYVVVDCPLPAGFELAGEQPGIDRFDDRIAFWCDLEGGRAVERRVAVVPTMAGRFVWPPTTAAPMYVSGLDGGTAGSLLDVVADVAGAVPAEAALPPCAVHAVDPAEDLAYDLREAWQVDTDTENPRDEATCQREFEQKLAEFPAVSDAHLGHWLVSATSLLENLDLPPLPLRPEQEWRIAARARIAGWQRVATMRALAEWAYPHDEVVRALAAWQDPKACEGPAAVLIRAGLAYHSTSSVNRVLDLLQAPVEAPELRGALWAMLADADVLGGDRALQLLSPEDRLLVPPVLVIAGQDQQWDDGVVTLLAATAAGRAELQQRLQDPQFVKRQRELLAGELPASLWQQVPLAAFAGWADTLAVPHDWQAEDLVRRIAGLAFPAASLQQAMAATHVPAWRDVLARVLRAGGAGLEGAAGPGDDPAWPAWQRVLAVGGSDAAGATVLAAQLQDDATLAVVDGERDCMLAMLVRIVVAAGTPEQLYAARERLDGDAWEEVWDRLTSADRIALVERFQKHVPYEFVPATAAEADALWRFLVRSGDTANVFAVMRQSHCGFVCLRTHLLAGDLAAHTKDLADSGLAAVLRAPPGDEPWDLLLTACAREESARELDPRDRDRLQALFVLRGLGPIGP